jgi:maleamate amidohydrolase
MSMAAHGIISAASGELRQAQSRWFAADGLALHTLEFAGEGNPVVVLPGITSPAATWTFVVEALAGNRWIILLDARGRGASDKPPTGYATADYVNDLKALIDAFGLKDPLLVGHSMGARVVAAFDVAFPQVAKALVVIDPPMSGPGRRPYPIPVDFYLEQRRQVLSGASVADLAKGARTWSEARIRDRIAWLPSCSEPAILLSHAGFHHEGFLEAWPKVTAPALFVRGVNSPVVESSDLAEAKAAKPRADYVEIARSGHMIPWDNLDDFVETLDRYLKLMAPVGADSAPGAAHHTDGDADETFFRDRGFGKQIGFGRRAAVLVIDFVQAFTDPKKPLGAPLENEIAATNRLIDAARARHLPVLFSSVRYDDKGLADAGIWSLKQGGASSLQAGTTGSDLDHRLHHREDDVLFYKKYASCFFGTDLTSRLLFKGVDTLIVAGCTTSGCVRATAVDACQIGFRPIVVREAVGDRSRRAHQQSLFDLHAKYADVVSLDAALDYLAREPVVASGHRDFVADAREINRA